MENYYQSPGDGPADPDAAQRFPPGHDVPSGHQWPARDSRWEQPPGMGAHQATGRRKALPWTIGLTAAALLATGSVIAGMTLTGGSAPTATTSPASTAGPTGQAALLAATLSAADSPDAAAPAAAPASSPAGPGRAAAAAVRRRCARAGGVAAGARLAGRPGLARAARHAIRRCREIRRRVLRLILLNGVDGQFTFRTASGLRTLAYERGVIQSVSPGRSFVVKSADGTTWTWSLAADTVVREHGRKAAAAALSDGEPVWAGGPVTGGTRDARLIVIRPPAAATTPGG